jgi:hypothetical protein
MRHGVFGLDGARSAVYEGKMNQFTSNVHVPATLSNDRLTLSRVQ